jgi:DNA mismatch endonuclease, patch repair protein
MVISPCVRVNRLGALSQVITWSLARRVWMAPAKYDVFSKRKRSEVMSRIRSRFTSLDLKMEKALSEAGVEFRMYPKEFGNPDFLVGNRVAIFCDSSFWHGRNWPALRKQLLNGSRPEYWVEHIGRNRKRDRLVTRELSKEGFTVIRFWDTDIQHRLDWCVRLVRTSLEKERHSLRAKAKPR